MGNHRGLYISTEGFLDEWLLTLWQWGLIFALCFWGGTLSTLLNPDNVVVQFLSGLGTVVCLAAGTAYITKYLRYGAQRWKGEGMILRDFDSGAKQVARIYLRRERPSFLLTPLSHVFLKWVFIVGEVDMLTGSVSISKVFVSVLIGDERKCRQVGTRDCIYGAAAQHVLGLGDPSSVSYTTSGDVKECIKGLVASGLRLNPALPFAGASKNSGLAL